MKLRRLLQPAAALGVAGLLLALAPSARGWTAQSQYVIGEQAARLVPPDLYRQLVRNRASFRLGIEDPYRNGHPDDRYKLTDGRGRLDEAIRISVQHAMASITSHQRFNDIAFRLGVVAHYVAMANNPLYTEASDPQQGRWAQDFLHYLESVEPRIEMVFYGFRRPSGANHLDQVINESLARSRRLYPLVGREYRRVSFAPGSRAFDDRSTAYAIASLGYSHAVSDIAEVLRYIWLESGGADSRPLLPLRGRQVIRLSRETEPRGR